MARKLRRLNWDVIQTKVGRAMFPGEPCGTLLYICRNGGWMVRRDGQRTATRWGICFWRRLRKSDVARLKGAGTAGGEG